MPRIVITKGVKFRKELVFTDADIITIGRVHTSDIVLPDSSRRLSRYQAAVIRASGPQERYFLRDLSSLRPTKVRGEAISQKLLQDGDVITIADYELVYFRAAVEAEEEEGVALIVVRQKEDDKAAQRDGDLTWKSIVLLTHQELLKEILLVPKRREVVEALLSRARAVSTLGDLFEILQEPILHVLSATRGFVGLFRGGHQGAYSGVGVRGFDPKKGERIAISDAAFLERLQQGEYVQERTTLLVPLLLRNWSKMSSRFHVNSGTAR
jgi:pSer/pThr/pTyr-binding forkhead associated (FHA) protein